MTAAVEGDEKHHFVCTLLRVKVHSSCTPSCKVVRLSKHRMQRTGAWAAFDGTAEHRERMQMRVRVE